MKVDSMKLSVTTQDLHQLKTGAWLGFWYEGEFEMKGDLLALDKALDGNLSSQLQSRLRTGKFGEVTMFWGVSDSLPPVALVGLGPRQQLSAVRMVCAAGAGAKALASACQGPMTVVLPDPPDQATTLAELAESIVRGVLVGVYQFTNHRKMDNNTPRVNTLKVWQPKQSRSLAIVIRRAGVLASFVNWARDLANEPGNVMTPVHLAKTVTNKAKSAGLKTTIYGEKELKKLNANLILAVAAGSQYPPQMVVLEHTPVGCAGQPIVFIGKGITFDTGGTNLKSRDGMTGMKFDMSGAAAVAGALCAIAELDIKVPVVGVLPLAENHLGGRAQRTDDIVKAMNGLSVEIKNTDAEGRLVLADAISYTIEKYKPQALVDLATLTGACEVALGKHCAGVMGNTPPLVERLINAGGRVGERLWELPLWDDYQEQISSEYADLANIGGRAAGAITAGCFLSRFAGETPFAHVDIAGVADSEKAQAWQVAGATGFGVALLVKYIQLLLSEK